MERPVWSKTERSGTLYVMIFRSKLEALLPSVQLKIVEKLIPLLDR